MLKIQHTLKYYKETKQKHPSIEASLELYQNHLKLAFTLLGAFHEYQFSQPQKQQRANELWRATCFECFIANKNDSAYYEINISPSLEWNIYHFDEYKKGMKASDIFNKPTIEVSFKDSEYRVTFEATFKRAVFEQNINYNLSVILLDKEEQRHFFSINQRANGVADFHDRESFEDWRTHPYRKRG